MKTKSTKIPSFQIKKNKIGYGIFICARCGKKDYKNSPNKLQKYCGSHHRKEGCSHIVAQLRRKKWREDHPEYMKTYLKKYKVHAEKSKQYQINYWKKYFKTHDKT